MAILKDLIVQGPSRFIGEAKGTKFVTDGGTSSLFIKGDGSLDSTEYVAVTKGTKTYTGVIGTADNNPGAVFYFLSVKPKDWNAPCVIKYKISASMAGQVQGTAQSVMSLCFCRNTVLSYDVWNYIGNTSYSPYYYHYRYLVTLTGYNAGYGHLVGIGLLSSYGPTSSTYARTFVIDVLEAENCDFTFLSSMTKYASVPGTGSTNYSGETTYNATTLGETHSGDANDVNYQNREYYGCRKTNSALYRYTLCLTKSDGSLVPLNSVSNTVATTKELTSDSFDPFGEIFYWNSTTTYSAGTNVGDGAWYRQILFDARYSFNTGGYSATGTLVARSPVYLVAVPHSEGTAVLNSTPLALALPTEDDGLIYIYLGRVYPDNYPYRISLSLNHPVYHYKNGAVRLWTSQEEHLALTSEEIDRDIIEIVEFKDSVFKLTLILRWNKEIPSVNGEFPKVALDTLTAVPSGFMSGSNITSIEDLENFTSLTSLNSGEFNGCQYLTSITIPDNIQSIGNGVFAGSSVSSVTFGSNLEVISNNAFLLCLSLTTLSFPSSLKTLDSGAFATCTNLTSVTLNEGLLTIGGGTFYNTGITSITIPSTVTDIYTLALSTSTVIVDFGNTRTSIVPYYGPWGSTVPNLTAIIVPDNLVNDWKSTVGWSSIASYIVGYSEYYNN